MSIPGYSATPGDGKESKMHTYEVDWQWGDRSQVSTYLCKAQTPSKAKALAFGISPAEDWGVTFKQYLRSVVGVRRKSPRHSKASAITIASYRVTFDDGGEVCSLVVSARSRGAAKCSAFFLTSFPAPGDFFRAVLSVRKLSQPFGEYRCLNKRHGTNYKPGDRVESDGLLATVGEPDPGNSEWLNLHFDNGGDGLEHPNKVRRLT